MTDKITDPEPRAEIAALTLELHQIDRRLQVLGGGAVDGVMSPAGQFFLLRQAQLELVRSESEQRSLASKLRAEQARLVEAEATAKIGSWSADLATDELRWSPEMYRIYGLGPGEGAPTMRLAFERIHPDDRARTLAANARLSIRSVTTQLDVRLVLPGNVIKFIEQRWDVEFDAKGIPQRAFGTCQDVTERVRTERTLRDSQTQLQIATRLSHIGTWHIDLGPASGMITWSDEICAIHEVPPRTSPTFDEALEFYSPPFRAAILQAFRNCAQLGAPFDVELEVTTATGKVRSVRAIGEAVRNGNGAIIQIQGAFQDLTEHKQREHSSRRLAEQLTKTLESLTIGFLTVDSAWRVTYFNAEAERLFKSRREDVIGRILWNQIPELLNTELEHGFRAAFAERRSILTETRLGPGRPWVRATADPIEGGLALYLQDNSGEREALRKLQLLKAGVAQANDIIFILRAATAETPQAMEFANDAASRITGYSHAEVMLLGGGAFLHGPETDLAVVARIVAAIKSFQPIRVELVNYTKAGKPFFIDLLLEPLAENGSKLSHFLIVCRDISERKRDQATLHELNSTLETRIRGRTAALANATQWAEEANRAKSTFLATMSHEIRTPMNGVIGLIEVVAQTPLDSAQTEMVTLIRDSADSLLQIIDDLLDFTKIEAGKLSLACGPLQLAEAVHGTCRLLAAGAANRDVKLEFFVDPQIPTTVIGDELRLRQVLLNLISNAIKFSAGRSEPGRVSVRAKRLESSGDTVKVEIMVADNGIGIDEPTLERLFLPFSQGDHSTTRRFGGTGLGLAISRDLLRLMQGSINVTSEAGKGSEFKVCVEFLQPSDTPFDALAIAADRGGERDGRLEEELLADECSSEQSRLIGAHVLVAEDHETNREVIARQLAMIGVTADFAVDGQQALEFWRAGRYTLLLTDLRMPHLDGYGLTAAIRSEELPNRVTAIVALTANALPEEESRCLAAGMDQYLSKPVRLPQLKGAIERWLKPRMLQ